MAEARAGIRQWKPDDIIEAQRLQMMQDLAESAQLSAVGSNVHLHKSALGGGTAIAVDNTGRSDSFLKFVWLTHTTGTLYSAYAKDDPDKERDPVGTSLQPLFRELGTAVDFVEYAETGLGYFNTDGDFILLFAHEERYDTGACPV